MNLNQKLAKISNLRKKSVKQIIKEKANHEGSLAEILINFTNKYNEIMRK